MSGGGGGMASNARHASAAPTGSRQMRISFVIVTRDRPEELRLTLAALGALDGGAMAAAGGAEVVVVDNASRFLPQVPERLANGVEVRLVLREENEGAAGRNAGARTAHGAWIVMLDDDSQPLDCGFLDEVASAPPDVAAIGAEILLPDGSHERGGLPEVFIGCGVAIRRDVFLDLGGYDASFGYYVEEYDLAAKMLLAGWRVVHSRGWRVLHRKVAGGRDMNVILGRLVRNNGWVEQRYAPEGERDGAIERLVDRYGAIASKESAREGFERGVAELRSTLRDSARREMPEPLYDRFTGLAHARARLGATLGLMGVARVAIVEPGKNEWAVRQALDEAGVEVVERGGGEGAVVVGTLSPGPILDGVARWAGAGLPVVAPWCWCSGLAPATRRTG